MLLAPTGQTIFILGCRLGTWICKSPKPNESLLVLTSGAGKDMSLFSSTASLRSSILRNMEENGRKYHGYKEGKYVLPVDEVNSTAFLSSLVLSSFVSLTLCSENSIGRVSRV